MTTRRRILASLGILTALPLLGCEKNTAANAVRGPVPIADGEECHVCGMIINDFPGPKGQAFVQGAEQPLKFCSTRDLFAFLTQPEARSVTREVYVHDMGVTAWDAPAFEAFTDARAAHYVVCQPLPGAMGPTLAAFKEPSAAEAFAAQHDGRIIGFAEIDAGLITDLTQAC